MDKHNFNLILIDKPINWEFMFISFSACQTAVHKKCHDKLLGTCSESGFNSESTIVSSKYSMESNQFDWIS